MRDHTRIRIGHSVYGGDNRVAWARSKAEAVRILRQRGIKRNDARAAVNRACLSDWGYQTVRGGELHYGAGEVIEILNAVTTNPS